MFRGNFTDLVLSYKRSCFSCLLRDWKDGLNNKSRKVKSIKYVALKTYAFVLFPCFISSKPSTYFVKMKLLIKVAIT